MIPLLMVMLAAMTGPPRAPQPLEVVTNERLAYILMNFQIVRETTTDESKAFRVRILSVPEHGECGGSPQTCPKRELFIAVSSIDEYPDQRVYQLPKRHDWRFVRWNRFPDVDGPLEFVEFTLEADDPSPDPGTQWWRTTRYGLKVNYREARISEQTAG